VAWDPDEILATIETPTYLRARSREKVIEKARRRWLRAVEPIEEVVLRPAVSEPEGER
jgi:hypothetical protein